VTIEATGLTPGARALLLVGSELGSAQLPGTACEGVELGITSPAFRKRVSVGEDGTFMAMPSLGGDICEGHIVLVDMETCEVSAPSSLQGPSTRDVTFQVDMGCMLPTYGTVFVTGPWNGWTASNPMTDVGDGIWQTTVALDVGTTQEYKFMVDDWASQEQLIDDMVAGATCAPVTDYFNYANRTVEVSNDLIVADTYGTCSDTCSSVADVTFAVDLNCLGYTPYAVSLPGPDVGWDFGARTLQDNDNDGIWTGTFSFPAGADVEYTIALDDWQAQELLWDDMAAGGTCATSTDYATYANRQLVAQDDLLVEVTYDSCTSCP
jgi:1,4-alpha-glucan branching enzyme